MIAVDYLFKRVNINDFNLDRMKSLEEAVSDFIGHYKEDPAALMGIWKWIVTILSSHGLDRLYCAFDEDKVVAYFIVSPQQELSGQWYLFIHHAWGHKDLPLETKQDYLKSVCEDSFKSGMKTAKFLTKRNVEAFREWLPKEWTASQTLFELRCNHG